jgi:soluble lytic murein transglycosylase
MVRFLLALITFATVAFAADPDSHSRIRDAHENRNYPSAIAELKTLKSQDPVVFAANNYEYLLGRLAERVGDHSLAIASYTAVSESESVLKQYGLWRTSRLLASMGNFPLERIFLQELLAKYPKSVLAPAAHRRMAFSLFDGGNFELVISRLESPQRHLNSSQTVPAEDRDMLLLLARSYMFAGKIDSARKIFTQLVSRLKNPAQPDDIALEAVRGLDILDVGVEGQGRRVAELPDHEHLRRAIIYQFNREFENARLHYSAIVNTFTESGNTPDAVFQVGRGYVQQGNFGEAILWFERAIEQFSDHPVRKDALLQAASAYARLGKHREAISRYQRFIDSYGDDERLDRAYLNIIDILRDQGEDSEALRRATMTQEVFRGKTAEAQALFAEARIYIARDEWEKAIVALEKLSALPDLGGTRVPGGASKPEVAFLRAFTLEKLRRYSEAINIYLSIPDGRNEYYGWLSTLRLRRMAEEKTSSGSIQQALYESSDDLNDKNADLRRKALQNTIRMSTDPVGIEKLLSAVKLTYKEIAAYNKTPTRSVRSFGRQDPVREKTRPGNDVHGAIADELIFLGLYDEAAGELEASGRFKGPDAEFSIAAYYLKGDIAHRAVKLIEPEWRQVPADYQVELIPEEAGRYLYPAPYRHFLLEHSTPRKIDPRFLLSIMRQESRFRPDAKSNAAARGLMQFIATTANRIAGELKFELLKQDQLYEPETAILFGAQYTGDLLRLFPNQLEAAAASYNGGEDNMQRWLKRSRSGVPERYVPEIAFAQSKDYVYKVMANYRVYQALYDESLNFRQR